jgi:hypothetical protein
MKNLYAELAVSRYKQNINTRTLLSKYRFLLAMFGASLFEQWQVGPKVRLDLCTVWIGNLAECYLNMEL